MNFSEYKNYYYSKWQKVILPCCWIFFAISAIVNVLVAKYFFSTEEFQTDFQYYVFSECVIPLSLEFIAITIITIRTTKLNKEGIIKIQLLVWLYFWLASITGFFYCRFEPALYFPCTTMILAALLLDKGLVKLFFTLSLVVITSGNAIRLIRFNSSPVFDVFISLLILYLADISIFIISLHLCKLQRNQVLMLYKNYLKQKKLNRELRREPLTRLYNRAAYATAVEKLIKISEKNENPIVQVLIDLDDFKHVNDTYGHSAGDAVLISIGEMIHKYLGKRKLGFRYGGDEFVMIFTDREIHEVMETINKLREEFSKHEFDFLKKEDRCTITMGAAPYQKGWNSKQWFQAADAAAYIAKSNGKNRCELAR